MALAHHDQPIGTVSNDQFRAAVRRNIKALLAMHGMEQRDLAPYLGLSESQLSTRMSNGKNATSWRDAELINAAAVLGVTFETVMAQGEQDFREALARSKCFSGTGRSRHLTVVPDIPAGWSADGDEVYAQAVLFGES